MSLVVTIARIDPKPVDAVRKKTPLYLTGILIRAWPWRGRQMIEYSFLRNCWYVAGWASEFEASSPAGRLLLDEPVVLYRTASGKMLAFEDRCAHRWAPLSRGRVEGENLRCMYHGLKYGPDGRCLEVPGEESTSKALCIRAYPVIERFRFVWVWMGDPGSADPSLIPDLSMLDQPWRRLNWGRLDYEANYSLINDNLLDLSHIGFLHENTLGRLAVDFPKDHVRPRTISGKNAQPIDGGVRFDTWSNLLYRTRVLPKNFPEGDLWTRTDFLVPGIFVSNWKIYPKGTAEECKGPPGPELSPLSDSMSIQAVVPMTTRKSRYFYSLGHRKSDMDEQESAAIWAIVQDGFAEDLEMIQAQQRTIDNHPGRRMVGIHADRGLMLFRSLMKKLIAKESLGTTEQSPRAESSTPCSIEEAFHAKGP